MRGHHKRLNSLYDKRGDRISELKKDKKGLEVQIRREKKASQQYLDGILAEATILRDEAAVLKTEANDIKSKAEATIVQLR